MPLYTWNESPIAQMECTHLPRGSWQIEMRPRPGPVDEVLSDMHRVLTHKHIAHFIKSDHAIVIPQLANDKMLLALMREHGWTSGEPQVIPIAGDKQKPETSVGAFVQDHSVMLASSFYNLANAFWIVSGVQRARHNKSGKFTKNDMAEMMVGITFALGDVLLGIYGKDKKKQPLLAFSDALEEHLQQHGIVVPDEATPENLHKSGVIAAVDGFLHKHIIGVKAVSKIAGGGFMIHAALKPGNLNEGKLTTGAMLAAGWLATLVLDTKTSLPYTFKEDSKSDSHLPKWMQYYAENPRKRITAPLTTASSVPKLIGSIVEAKRFHGEVRTAKSALENAIDVAGAQSHLRYTQAKQFDYVWNLATTASMTIGTYFFAKSGDKATRKVKDMDKFEQDMLMVSANMLAHIPPHMRQHAIEEAADYIGDIKGVKETKQQIAAAISTQVSQLSAGAFAEHAPLPAR